MSRTAPATVGIVANPLAGKDARRLTSGAMPVSDAVKISTIRRTVVGAIEGGAERVLISGDRAHLGERALAGRVWSQTVEVLPEYGWHSGRDTELAVKAFRDRGTAAIVALGGDGTQRDVAKGWRDVPLAPLSVGTNNVFPQQLEATVVGFAAGAVASGRADANAVTSQAKILDVVLPERVTADIALVDVCLVRGGFVGARAVWDVASIREIVAIIAEPTAVGLSAVAAAVAPVGRHESGGVHIRMGCAGQHTQRVRAAVLPGSYADVDIAECLRVPSGKSVRLTGPGVLALDGEREIVLDSQTAACVTVNDDGPQVIDIGAAVSAAQHSRYSFGSACSTTYSTN